MIGVRRPRSRWVVALLAPVAIALLAGAAAGGEGVLAHVPGFDDAIPPEKAAAVRHTLAPSDPGSESPVRAVPPPGDVDRIPAHLLSGDAPVPVSPELLEPTNAWLVSDGRTLVAVYAGADGHDPRRGRLVIVRQDLEAGTQTLSVVDAGPGGAVAITAAPMGEGVETAAQHGRLTFRSMEGRAGVLDLALDRASGPAGE